MEKFFCLSFLTGLFLFFGCKSHDENEKKGVEQKGSERQELGLSRVDFIDLVNDRVDAISLEIISTTQERSVQKAAIEMKKFFSKRLRRYRELDDVREGFVKTWALVYRFNIYINGPDGGNLFGGHQPMVQKVSGELLNDFKLMAKKELSKEQYEATEEALKKYVVEHEVYGYFQDKPESESFKFFEYLNLPFAPFKAVDSFNKSGESIEDISKTVARFTDIAEELPEEIRWQLQALAAQLQNNGILKTNTESFSKLAESSEKLTKIIEAYPEEVTKKAQLISLELDERIKQLAELSKQVDVSMGKLEKSSENFKNLGESVERSVAKVDTTVKEVESSSQALTKAAEEVGKVVKQIYDLTVFIEEKSGGEKRKEGEDSYMVEVKKAAEALEKSASEVVKIFDRIEKLGENKLLSEEVKIIEGRAKETLVVTRKESEALVDYIFRKALLLVVIIFVFLIILIIFKRRKGGCSKSV